MNAPATRRSKSLSYQKHNQSGGNALQASRIVRD
jgi:hypothetical protein